MNWVKLAEVIGINIGLILVIYWLIQDRRDFTARLFTSIATIDKVFYVLEKMERKIQRND